MVEMNYILKLLRAFYRLAKKWQPIFVIFIFQWLIYLDYQKTGRFAVLLIVLNFIGFFAFLGSYIEKEEQNNGNKRKTN